VASNPSKPTSEGV